MKLFGFWNQEYYSGFELISNYVYSVFKWIILKKMIRINYLNIFFVIYISDLIYYSVLFKKNFLNVTVHNGKYISFKAI